MSYWTVRKTHSQQAYNDVDEYTLWADNKFLMSVHRQYDAEYLQKVADAHNQEVMELSIK